MEKVTPVTKTRLLGKLFRTIVLSFRLKHASKACLCMTCHRKQAHPALIEDPPRSGSPKVKA